MEETFVVFTPATGLYLRTLDPNPDVCQWDVVELAIEYRTLSEAESVALGIGGGTVGTPKPK